MIRWTGWWATYRPPGSGRREGTARSAHTPPDSRRSSAILPVLPLTSCRTDAAAARCCPPCRRCCSPPLAEALSAPDPVTSTRSGSLMRRRQLCQCHSGFKNSILHFHLKVLPLFLRSNRDSVVKTLQFHTVNLASSPTVNHVVSGRTSGQNCSRVSEKFHFTLGTYVRTFVMRHSTTLHYTKVIYSGLCNWHTWCVSYKANEREKDKFWAAFGKQQESELT